MCKQTAQIIYLSESCQQQIKKYVGCITLIKTPTLTLTLNNPNLKHQP